MLPALEESMFFKAAVEEFLLRSPLLLLPPLAVPVPLGGEVDMEAAELPE
jgi:hypothetical protein